MQNQLLAIAVGAVFFWAFQRMLNPVQRRWAVHDFLKVERKSEQERRLISKSFLYEMVYPVFAWIQQRNPMSRQAYKELQNDLEKAGEYDTRPDDIQIAQITNALVYPLFFALLGIFFGGEQAKYYLLFGVGAGFYMYSQPIRTLKSKRKKHDERMLQEFTRFVTVYLMLSSGNKPAEDALLETISRTKHQMKALSFYLTPLESDIQTKGTKRALSDFAFRMNRSYVDRFCNNVLLSIEQAGSDMQKIQIRLRGNLNEMQNQLADRKIETMKLVARVPMYISILLIAGYMTVLLGSSFTMLM